MKTLEQIIRYVSHCKFNDQDWQKVLDFCRVKHSGGNLHRALSPISDSTFDEFMEWIDHGFGSGDIVRYGHTSGIVGSSTPSRTYLAAYLDFDGKLIVKELDVFPSKLVRLAGDARNPFEKAMFDNGLNFSPRLGKMVEMYRPKKFSYATMYDKNSGQSLVGMYLESDNNGNYHFSAAIISGKLYFDYYTPINCTPLNPSSQKEIKLLHQIAAKNGYILNGRTCQFVKSIKRGEKNSYWYINDRFEVVADKDNGSKKHNDRYDVGNYFIDYTEALLFAKSIIEKRKGGN